jgi:hypothetical protein
VAHVELLQGELTLEMTYGYEVQGRDDRKVEVAKKTSDMGANTALPSDLLVNGLPFLRHIPEWLPWFSYKPLARIGHDLGQEVMHEPIQFVKESMLNGTARPSLALRNLQKAERLGGSERVKVEKTIRETLASLYAAAADTVRWQKNSRNHTNLLSSADCDCHLDGYPRTRTSSRPAV